jgi:ribosome-associated protein
MKTERVAIRGESIRLCDLLKFAGVSPTGGEAKNAVESGKVTVNGAVCLVKGKQIRPGDKIVYGEYTIEVAGGAG